MPLVRVSNGGSALEESIFKSFVSYATYSTLEVSKRYILLMQGNNSSAINATMTGASRITNGRTLATSSGYVSICTIQATATSFRPNQNYLYQYTVIPID